MIRPAIVVGAILAFSVFVILVALAEAPIATNDHPVVFTSVPHPVQTSNMVTLISTRPIEGLCPDGCGQLNHHSQQVAVWSFMDKFFVTVSSATHTGEVLIGTGPAWSKVVTNLVPRQSPYQKPVMPPVPPLTTPTTNATFHAN